MAAHLYVAMPWFGTFAGGAAVALTSVALALRARGVAVSILTTCSRSPYEDWQRSSHPAGRSEADGLEVFRFPVDAGTVDGYHRAVRQRMNGEAVDPENQEAFFSQGMNSKALVEFVANLPESTPVLAGPYFQALVPTLVNQLPGRVSVMPALHDEPELQWAPVRRMMTNARRILFLTEEEKDLAIRHHGAAVGRRLVECPVVGLGVSPPPSLRDEESLRHAEWRARTRHGLPARYFLYCGRIELAKGLDRLLPWYERWARRRAATGLEAVPLVLLGAGQQGLVPNSACFRHVGYVDDESKFGVMRGAVALVNPSRYESFSYVIMESWLAGRPVIVNADCAVTTAHARRSGGGLAFASEASLGDALDSLLDDERSAAMGAGGNRYVQTRYWWPEVVERIMKALEIAP